MGLLGNLFERGGGGTARAGRLRVGQFLHGVGDPDLEELVEVRRHDAQVTQPLEQRHLGSAGHREHPGVECQRAEVPLQQHCGRRRLHGHQYLSIS
jgi:hypothetical protein